jgi:hypothetical protein
MWRSKERARLWALGAAWFGFAMLASASLYPASADCDWTVDPPECLSGDRAIKLGVSKGKIVVDEVTGDKVVKRQFWSKNTVRQRIRRAEAQCKRDSSTCEKTRNWRGELSRQLEVLDKVRKQ